MSENSRTRLDPRVSLRLRADVTPRWAGANGFGMEIFDLCASGAACRSPVFLPLKTQVGVVVRLPEIPDLPAREISCEAVVISIEQGRARDEWRAGLYFLNLTDQDREALRRFVFRALEARSTERGARAGQG